MPAEPLAATSVPGGPPPLVLLHGLAGTRADWGGAFEGWTDAPRRLLLDLPGHGDSPFADGADFDSTAEAFHETARSHQCLPAVWIGYSFGARLLWALALRRPDDLRALVLVSPHPGLAPDERERRRDQDEADARLLETRGLAAFLESWHARPIFDSRRLGRGWADEVRRKESTNRPADLAACFRRLGLGAQPDYRPRLSRIEAPVLLVTGERDAAYTRLAEEAVKVLPRARHVVVPGVGHGAHLEDPRAFQEALRAFLRTLPELSAARTP